MRAVTSPDGTLEFRIFVGQPRDSGLSRLAYQVFRQGKRIVDTSYLGLDIYPQEPLLGQYIGLIGSSVTHGADYNELRAHYMQNGSLGRLLDIDVRVSNGEVRFRYVIPPSTPLMEPFRIDDEKTEFAIEPDSQSLLSIGEENTGGYPKMTVTKNDAHIPETELAGSFLAHVPFTGPWRVIKVGN